MARAWNLSNSRPRKRFARGFAPSGIDSSAAEPSEHPRAVGRQAILTLFRPVLIHAFNARRAHPAIDDGASAKNRASHGAPSHAKTTGSRARLDGGYAGGPR